MLGKATACFNHDDNDDDHQRENEKKKKKTVCARLYIYSKINRRIRVLSLFNLFEKGIGQGRSNDCLQR